MMLADCDRVRGRRDASKQPAGFLAGDPDARSQFPARLGGRLRATAARIAYDLQERGHIDDVVQQAYALLLSRPAGHFDPSRGSAAAYLHQIVRSAARDIRAQYAPPGAPTPATLEATLKASGLPVTVLNPTLSQVYELRK